MMVTMLKGIAYLQIILLYFIVTIITYFQHNLLPPSVTHHQGLLNRAEKDNPFKSN